MPSPILNRIRSRAAAREREDRKRAAELAELAQEANDEGHSWERVAAAMGMTRQGLVLFRKRHGIPRKGRESNPQGVSPTD